LFISSDLEAILKCSGKLNEKNIVYLKNQVKRTYLQANDSIPK